MKQPEDTEDKRSWCKYGEDRERDFCKIADYYGFSCKKNPAKENDPFTHDHIINDTYDADLKTVCTPFFTANKYGFDPDHTITFNKKDYERYLGKYDPFKFFIIFWVRWKEQEKYKVKVKIKMGVWVASLAITKGCIESGQAKLHEYQKRKDDQAGNAKDSYILDLRWFVRKRNVEYGNNRESMGQRVSPDKHRAIHSKGNGNQRRLPMFDTPPQGKG